MSLNIKIFSSESIGFCFGVSRAVRIVEEALQNKEKLYISGPLIHNFQEVNRLVNKGLNIVNDLYEIPEDGTMIIRSHGISPDEYNRASVRGIKIIDATCPYVKKAQYAASKLHNEGYDVIIVGEEEHPEVTGILACSPGAFVISHIEALKMINLRKSVGILSQTTQRVSFFLEVISFLIDKTFELKIFNTICSATEKRQRAALKLAREVNMVLVVGGKNSANTKRLVDISREQNIPVYHVETSEEIFIDWFCKDMKVGIVGGSSTPEWLINDIIYKIRELCD